MADSYVEVTEGSGKKLQTHENTVGANDVHAEAIVPVHTDGTELTDANGVKVVQGTAANLNVTEASAAAIKTAVELIDNTVSGTELQVDVVAELPAGTQLVGNVKVSDGTETANVTASNELNVLESNSGAIKTAVELLDNAISGTEMQVDVVAALPAGTNAIGKLSANSGVDIGDVDITSQIPGTGATNLGKAEDALHTTGDTGVLVLGVRNDTPTSRVNVDSDYTPLAVDEYGRLRIVIDNATDPFDSADWKYADINDAVSGNNTIVAAQGAGNKIAVWSVMVVSDGTVDVRFEDGAGGTAFTGQIPLQEREGFTYSSGGMVPLWVGTANTLLNLELSAAINVHGHVSYTVVT